MPIQNTQRSEISTTLRHPPYSYIRLSLTKFSSATSTPRTSQSADLDPVTALSYLNSAVQSYLGLVGTAVPIDILKTENQDAWIRVPYEDASAVVASVSQWSTVGDGQSIALKIKSTGVWLGRMLSKDDDGKLWTLEKQHCT
jgi:ribonuclease P/MRP protein subunit POP8